MARFKSVIVDNGDMLVNCLADIDLSPVRTGVVTFRRANGMGFSFWSPGFACSGPSAAEGGFAITGSLCTVWVKSAAARKEPSIPQILSPEERAGFELSTGDRFRYRTHYFTDSGVLGKKEFVRRCYQMFRSYFASRHEKRPRPISGLEGTYSFKRLSEVI